MTDHQLRDELRAAVPALEPDEAFLAQLSARATAGAMTAAPARPAGGWRVALAPVAVAAVLVGIAWLTGLRPSGITDPTPAPQPTDATTNSTTRAPSPASTPRPASSTAHSHPSGTPGTRPSTPAAQGAGGPSGHANPETSQAGGAGQGAEHANARANGHPQRPPKPVHVPGPDEHAGLHPAPQAGQDRRPR